jgi:hypothetical protein
MLRGQQIIDLDDPRIGNTVYHVTIDMPSVEGGQVLRAGAAPEGLGGEARSVSFTVSREAAERLETDMKGLVRVHQQFLGTEPAIKTADHITWAEDFIRALETETGYKLPWNQQRFPGEGEMRSANAILSGEFPEEHFSVMSNATLQIYDAKRLEEEFFDIRRRHFDVGDPLFLQEAEDIARLDPDKIGLIEVPKENLRTGAAIVDFDLGNPLGMQEVRIYGDVMIGDHYLQDAAQRIVDSRLAEHRQGLPITNDILDEISERSYGPAAGEDLHTAAARGADIERLMEIADSNHLEYEIRRIQERHLTPEELADLSYVKVRASEAGRAVAAATRYVADLESILLELPQGLGSELQKMLHEVVQNEQLLMRGMLSGWILDQFPGPAGTRFHPRTLRRRWENYYRIMTDHYLGVSEHLKPVLSSLADQIKELAGPLGISDLGLGNLKNHPELTSQLRVTDEMTEAIQRTKRDYLTAAGWVVESDPNAPEVITRIWHERLGRGDGIQTPAIIDEFRRSKRLSKISTTEQRTRCWRPHGKL